jgi:hypothetical protein
MAKPPKKGSITRSADAQNERISEISNVNRTISTMQKQVKQDLVETETDLGDSQAISSVQHSLTKVLNRLSQTVGDIGKGFSRVAVDTAKAGGNIVAEYGKAIGEDLKVNRENLLTMTIAKSSPIYGYFIAKFMQTNVWKSATEKMKGHITSSLSTIGNALKDKLTGLWRGLNVPLRFPFTKKKDINETPTQKAKRRSKEKIPHMQTGGYVEKSGLAKVHAAEVVVPIDKILSRIDESIGVAKTVASVAKFRQLAMLGKISGFVEEQRNYQKSGLIKGFLHSLRTVHERYNEPSNLRMLRAVLAIQDKLGAQIGTWQQVWQKMLVEHPVFRNIMFASRALIRVFSIPFRLVYSLFRGRGGYKSHLSKSKEPGVAAAENLGAIYVEGMWRLDNISLFTKATAEATRDISTALTGKRYKTLKDVSTKRWSIAGLAAKALLFTTITGPMLAIHRTVRGTIGAVQAVANMIENRQRKKEEEGGSIQLIENTQRLLEVSEEAQQESAINYNVSQNVLDEIREQTERTANTSEVALRTTEEMNRREKRRTFMGFFTGAFSKIKGIFGGLLPLLLGFGGGFIIDMIKTAFLGKAGKGTILGGIGRGLVNIFKRMKLKFPAGFVGRLFPMLFKLKALMWIVAPLAKVALAWGVGGWIGKKLDEHLGITRRIEEGLSKIDKRNRELSGKVAAAQSTAMKAVRTGGDEGFQASQYLQHQGTIHQQPDELFKKDIGIHGRYDTGAVQQAQRDYIHENIDKYIMYDPEHVKSLRDRWIRQGGYWRGKSGMESAERYGALREESFLKYLKKHGRPLTEFQAAQARKEYDMGVTAVKSGVDISVIRELERNAAHYREASTDDRSTIKKYLDQGYQYGQKVQEIINTTAKETGDLFSSSYENVIKKASVAADRADEIHTTAKNIAQQEAGDLFSSSYENVIKKASVAADRADEIHTTAKNIAQQEAAELTLTASEIKDSLEKSGRLAMESTKGTTDKVVNAINEQTTIINNNSTVSNVTSAGRSMFGRFKDTLTNLTLRGKVDGD